MLGIGPGRAGSADTLSVEPVARGEEVYIGMRFDTQPAGLDELVYRRTMARLRLIIVTAGLVLLALVARLIIAGFTVAIGLTCALMASVLVAALTLRHRGRRLMRGPHRC
jgi:hypothetical protein